jgi:hypothetical protein
MRSTLSIMQIVRSLFAQTRAKINWALCELHSTLSVTALQWRSSGTTSSVFIMTAVYKSTLTDLQTRGFSPLFLPFYIFFKQQNRRF